MSAQPDLPAFARDFPEDPRLDALVRAFADGDYARVRQGVPEVVGTAESEVVKRAAEELLRRTKPDRLMVLLLVLTGALLVALSAYWVAIGP